MLALNPATTDLYMRAKGELTRERAQVLDQTGEYVASLKEDGWFASMTTSLDGNRFYTKSKRQIDYPDLERMKLPPGMLLLGELGYGTQPMLEKQKRLGHGFIVLFDILQVADEKVCSGFPERYRRKLLEEFVHQTNDPRIQIVEERTTGFVNWFDQLTSSGHEGLMIKRVKKGSDLDTTPYLPGGVNPGWWKWKFQRTWDVVITGVKESSKWGGGHAEHIEISQYNSEGVLVPVGHCGSFTTDIRYKLWQQKDAMTGLTCEVKGFCQFASGKIRHPSFVRFRPDKEPKDCVIGR